MKFNLKKEVINFLIIMLFIIPTSFFTESIESVVVRYAINIIVGVIGFLLVQFTIHLLRNNKSSLKYYAMESFILTEKQVGIEFNNDLKSCLLTMEIELLNGRILTNADSTLLTERLFSESMHSLKWDKIFWSSSEKYKDGDEFWRKLSNKDIKVVRWNLMKYSSSESTNGELIINEAR